MRSQKVILKNRIGLHARPAAIISIMALGAMKDDELIILTKGSDEDKCITELAALLESMDEEE